MAGPFTKERQEKLADDAKEFMTLFAKEYLKMYVLAMFNKVKDDIDGGEDEKRLQYRDWKSIQRADVFTGECYMRSGEGPGAFGAWKKVFVVERTDYNIAVYPDEKAYIANKTPKTMIRTAGYTVQRDPQTHYRQEMRSLGVGLGLSQVEVDKLTVFSTYSWALAHPWRTNYVFQIHKGAGGGGCCCFRAGAVEPDEAGAEFSERRKDYVRKFEMCSTYGSPRDQDSVSGRAFDLTVAKMAAGCDHLGDFTDEGYEAEILVDMLLQQCLTPVRDDMLHDMMGPVSIRLMTWYKTRGVAQKSLQGLSTPVWGTTQTAAQALGDKLEPSVRSGLGPILEAKEVIKDKIREKVIDKMGTFLQRYVTPFIEPILKAFDEPMTEAFQHAKLIYDKNVDIASLPNDKKERNLFLDAIPRTDSNTEDITNAMGHLIQPIFDLKALSGEVFADVDPENLRNMAQMSVLETLDAAVHTTEVKIDELGKEESIKEIVLKDYANDVQIARSHFMKEVVRSLLVTAFRKAISPVVDPFLEGVDDNIPEDLRDFISVTSLFEELVDMFVGEPIDKMVEKAYAAPHPQTSPATEGY